MKEFLINGEEGAEPPIENALGPIPEDPPPDISLDIEEHLKQRPLSKNDMVRFFDDKLQQWLTVTLASE